MLIKVFSFFLMSHSSAIYGRVERSLLPEIIQHTEACYLVTLGTSEASLVLVDKERESMDGLRPGSDTWPHCTQRKLENENVCAIRGEIETA